MLLSCSLVIKVQKVSLADGQCIVYATGGGVDEVRKMTIVVSAETEITPA